ncbi:MAG: hypothetical protein ABSG64_13555 [Solirubrobacteraceae bacterium]|jgi:hypothetical protein
MSRFGIEQHPRQPLSFKLTRRELFGSLSVELERRAVSDGGPAYTLTTLGALPDDDLARIVPQLVPECQLSIADGAVSASLRPGAPSQRLFAAAPANLAVLEAIDGQNSLGAIAELLRANSPPAADDSFAHVRDLFLELVLAHVATPA